MRTLITGGYGFVARHLAQHLVSCGDDVAVTCHGADKIPGSEASSNAVQLPSSVQTMVLDVTDSKAVKDLVSVLNPDAIYHLAAMAFVPSGEINFEEVFRVNTFGTLNVLNAVLECSPRSRVLVVSSSEVYGSPRPKTLPVNELSELRPISAYGVSKAAADLAAFQYSQKKNLEVIRVRPFPHIGPGQSSVYAISSFAEQLARIKAGRAKPIIRVGNLESKRDYSDVSDIVRGYREALLNGKRGEVYNLCSGKSVQIGEILQRLIAIAEVEVEVQEDASRLRAVDVPEIYGSFERATREFGWRPRIDLEATLHSLFAYWAEVVEKQA